MYITVRVLFFFALLSLVYSLPPRKHRYPKDEEKEDTLVLLHVLFRHGNRTGQVNELYPKDPYLNYPYFPFGNGQLTNAGKRREYSIGTSLRKTYDNFLGNNFYPAMYDAWSTNYNRTKASLLLALAGLFPPQNVEVWNKDLGIIWQPVPYNYNPTDRDPVLLGMNCPAYTEIYNANKYSPELQSRYDEHKETFEYISENTGLNVTSFEEVYNLYFGLSTEEEWGFKLPEWTKSVWPKIITDLAANQYYVYTATPELNAMTNGYLVKKIIQDTQNKIEDIDNEVGARIYLYSAHESNIGPLLVYLGVYNDLHIPTYGSYVVFEVHNINDVYGLKIYYQHYVTDEPVLLTLPNCEEFCPLDKFIALYQDLIPSDDMCGI